MAVKTINTEMLQKMFLAGAFLNAVPGIIIQLVLIPAVMVALGRTGMVQFHSHNKKEAVSE